jgi:hypothetical protein
VTDESRRREDPPQLGPYRLRTVLAWLAAWIGAFAFVQHPGYTSPFFEPRAVFHYYIGAKYFDEIGPFDLYGCVIAADRQGNRIWLPNTPVRDLHTYTMVPAQATSCPPDRFTAERWRAFVQDVSWFTGKATPADWALALTDKGYNASPFFSEVFGHLAARLAPLEPDDARAAFVVFNLDLVFLAIAIWIVWRSAGATLALLVLALALSFFGSFGRIGGNLGQYVWFPCLAAAAAAGQARRPAAAGAALGLATGFQIFPVMFAVPVVVSGVRGLVRRERERWMRSLVFSIALAGVIASCVAIGSVSPRGFDAWRAWRQKMAIHSAYLRGEVFDIGLSNALGFALSSDHANSDSYEHDIPHSLARQAALRAHRVVWFGLASVLIGLFVAAVWRVPEQAALAFGVVPMYALLAMSPYYYFALALMPFMAVGLPAGRFKVLAGGVALLFAVNLAIWNGSYISFSFGWHAATQALFAAFMLLVAMTPLFTPAETS